MKRYSGRDKFTGDPDLNRQRYGSEVGPRGRSKFSPRGNDQDWGDHDESDKPHWGQEWRHAEEQFSARTRTDRTARRGGNSYGGGMDEQHPLGYSGRGVRRTKRLEGREHDPRREEPRYGSEPGPASQRAAPRPYERGAFERDRPENMAGDMEDFGTTRAAQFGQSDYYGMGEHATRKFGMTGRGRDQYFASDDDRDWDRGQIVRGRATQRPREAGEQPSPTYWRTGRERDWEE